MLIPCQMVQTGCRIAFRLLSWKPWHSVLFRLLGGVDVLLAEATEVSHAPLPAPSHTEVWVREQVRQLRAYSMVEGDGRSIALHPLVQKVEQLNLDRTTGRRIR